MIRSVLIGLLLLISVNANAVPYRIEMNDLVTVTADGSLIPLHETNFDVHLDYSKVYYFRNFVENYFWKALRYPVDGKFKLSQESVEDLKYIKEKIRLGDCLQLIVAVPLAQALFFTEPDIEKMWELYDAEWEQMAQVIAKDVPQIIKSTIVNELNWILYKSLTKCRPIADINFWRSMLMAWQHANLENLIGVYTGTASNIEMPDIKIDIRLEIGIAIDNSFTGNLMLKVNGRGGNAFSIKNISINESDLVQFDQESYGRKSHFDGVLKGKEIQNFCSSFNGRKIWCTNLRQI
jgi:hypothetical protein